ncbi:hypothetical protein FOA52_007680 [Chlamydomonas sp. UWO 241]|nr:hypothetical protein FOA52_007680 [Chlamydomonas sp. UWO 241]
MGGTWRAAWEAPEAQQEQQQQKQQKQQRAHNTAAASAGASLDPKEAAKFAALASSWWEPTGPFAPLHRLNPARCQFIRAAVCAYAGADPSSPEPLAGLTALDVGCGGGILAESLARLGATVTAIDVTRQNVDAAAAHAARDPLVAARVRYECVSAETLVERGLAFDVVIASEVIEHVRRPDEFVATLARLLVGSSSEGAIEGDGSGAGGGGGGADPGPVPGSASQRSARGRHGAAHGAPPMLGDDNTPPPPRDSGGEPGEPDNDGAAAGGSADDAGGGGGAGGAPAGLLIVSTLNRTPVSFAVAVVGAEYIAGVVPVGTHDWRRFITPQELSLAAREAGLAPLMMAGMGMTTGGLMRLTDDTSVNYIASFGHAHTAELAT